MTDEKQNELMDDATPENSEAVDEDAGYAADNEVTEQDEVEVPELDDDQGDEIPEPEPEQEPEKPDWESRFKELEAQIAATRAAQQQTHDPEPDPLAAFDEDYPDIAEPVKKLIARQQQQFSGELENLRAQAFEEAMDAAKPEWRELRQDEKFMQWIQSNPDQQKCAQQPGVRSALKVIKAYESHAKAATVQAQRDARLQSAQATPTRGSRAPSLSDSLDGWAAKD